MLRWHARSESEGKALRTEADSLKDKVAALRTRLAGLHARRQAECELAAKKSEVLSSSCVAQVLHTRVPNAGLKCILRGTG